MDYKIHSLVYGGPLWGTIEEVAQKYNVDIDTLLKSLNEVVRRKAEL